MQRLLTARLVLIGLSVVFAVDCGGERPELPSSPAAREDTVIAEVNGVPILARQFDAMIEAQELRRSKQEALTADEQRELRRQSLELLISGELLAQAAVATGMTVSDDELDRLVGAARSQFADDEAFLAHLAQAGQSEQDLRRHVERRELMKAYAGQVSEDLVIDESEAQRFFREEQDRFHTPERVRATHVAVRLTADASQASRDEARRLMEHIRKGAEDGTDLAQLVTRQPDPSRFSVQADTGLVSRDRIPPAIDAALHDTEVGQVTPVIETAHGYHMCKVLERQAPRPRDFEEVRTSLLMLQARDQKNRTLRDHIAGLREQATIVIHDPDLAPAPPGV